MIPSHTDPRVTKALPIISRLRGILDQYERALQVPRAQFYADLDIPLRAVTVAEHYLAGGINRSIGRIPEVPVEEKPREVQPLPANDQREVIVNRWADRIDDN